MSSSTPSLSDTLLRMPSVSAAAWRRMGWLRRYLITSRAAVLPLTLHACLFGGLLALPWTPQEGWRLLLVSVGLVFAHAASNLLNDYVDWLVGLDRDSYFRLRYGAHPLAQGLMGATTHALMLLLTGAAALGFGLLVGAMAGTPAYVLAGAGALVLLTYTWPLKRLGLGEIAVFVVWGPLMVGGVYWVVSGDWGPEIGVLSAIAGLGPTVVVLAKHTDKARDDGARGVRTLPVLLGPVWAPRLLALVALGEVAAALAWAVSGGHWAYLLILVALPALAALLWICLRPRPSARPRGYPTALWPLWYAAAGFRFARVSGMALVLAALLDGVW
ncbi:MAG: prenyltransferase [Pseudomonadales bacterium]